MKTLKRNPIAFVTILSLLFVGFYTSCKKDHFLDGGIHDPNFDGSIWEYLGTRPELFDSLKKVIDLAGYTDLVDKENITLFAPTNQSIIKTMMNLNEYLYLQGQDTVLDLSQVDPAVWQEFLSLYILKEPYVLKDFPQIDTNDLQTYPGQGYLTLQEKPMNIGVLYNDVVSKNSDGVEQVIKYAGYRQLYINYVRNFMDANTIRGMITAPVATSDIRPKNGVLHVLVMEKHSFGFDSYNFLTKAYGKGIN